MPRSSAAHLAEAFGDLKLHDRDVHFQSRRLTGSEYINLTCKFVVKPGIHPRRVSPDTLLPRAWILRVIAPSTECPICLETALAPRMLGCGHVMCLPCFNRFVHLADERLCPICGERFGKYTLPTTFSSVDTRFLPDEGHEVVLKLMAKTGSGQAVPADLFKSNSQRLPSLEFLEYCRVVEGTAEYCCQELSREVGELIRARSEALADGEDDWPYKDAIAETKKSLSSVDVQTPPDSSNAPLGQEPNGSNFFFYQTAFEASNVYILQPLDVSVLKQAYGEYNNFPRTLVTRVDAVTYAELDRKRFKFLSHLPSHTTLSLLECDWRNVLPEEALKKYHKQLTARRRQHVSQKNTEERRRLKANAEMETRVKLEVLDLPVSSVEKPVDLSKIELPSLPSKAQSAPVKQPNWRDKEREEAYNELMAGAYVVKRGRKRTVLKP